MTVRLAWNEDRSLSCPWCHAPAGQPCHVRGSLSRLVRDVHVRRLMAVVRKKLEAQAQALRQGQP